MRKAKGSVSLALLTTFSLLAFLVPAAQAAENLNNGGQAAVFKIEGVGTALVQVADGIANQENISKLLIPERNAYIRCTEGTTEVVGFTENLAMMAADFFGCKTFEETTNEGWPACAIPEEKIAVDALIRPKKHENELYVLLEGAQPNAVFGTIHFGAECVLGVKVSLKGSVVGLVDNGNEEIEHLITFSEAIQKLFQIGGQGDKLLFGNTEAFAVGSAKAQLVGEHLGSTWRVI